VELERQREKRLKAQQQALAAAQQRQAMAAEAAQARATFGAVVAARINAAKFYPSEARSAGIVGVVAVRFAIGSDGRVTQATLSQSSGSAVLDAAALQIFRSLQTPEPPGGSFSGSINIRYSLGRS
jgi:protein TonB